VALLPSIFGEAREIYTDIPATAKAQSSFASMIFGSSPQDDNSVSGLLQKHKVKTLRDHMNELRVTKSDAEVANLRKAGQASGRAFTEAMRSAWTNEKDLETFIEYGFKAYGCEESAYVPVVAGGSVGAGYSSCVHRMLTLHRTHARSIMFGMMQSLSEFGVTLRICKADTYCRDGKLVTVDAGGVSMLEHHLCCLADKLRRNTAAT